MPVKSVMREFLLSRRLPVALALLAMLLVLPSLWTGFQLDDYFQRYFLLGNTGVDGRNVSASDLFDFLDGDPGKMSALRDAGLVPWWTFDRLKISFWRPLTGYTHVFDYTLWPGQPVLMHGQNLLWFGALVWIAALLYRRFGRTGSAVLAAGLAAFLFAVDESHGLPAGWLANRNALVAGVFGMLALLAMVKTHTDRWRPGWYLGPAALAAGLLAGESTLGVTAYLFSYALFFVEGGFWEKTRSLFPYALVSLAWMALYHGLGYGVFGSGFYVDPISEPAGFLRAVAVKFPILLLDQWTLPVSSLFVFLDTVPKIFFWCVAVALLAGIGIVLSPLLRGDRTARFWTVGMLLSIPVICTTVPHGRLLIFTGLGGAGVLGLWLGGMWDREWWTESYGIRVKFFRGTAYVLVLFHMVAAPVLLPLNSLSGVSTARFVQDPAERMLLPAGIEDRTLVLVNPPLFFFAQQIPPVRFLNGQSVPGTLRMLAPGDQQVRLTRLDEKSLKISTTDGWITSPFDDVFRGPDDPMSAGDTIRLKGMSVEILRTTPDGRPAEAIFLFHHPLESGEFYWMKWEADGYVPFELPSPGSTIEISALDFFS